MISDEEIREICERVAQALRSAYRRGEADAIERVLRAAKADAGETLPIESDVSVVARSPSYSGERKRRAPKGAVRALVRRVMSETEGPTVAEIKDRAANDVERAIANSSIRAHLRTGHAAGHYVERHGRWYRANPVLENGEAADPAEGQAASDWSGQREHHDMSP